MANQEKEPLQDRVVNIARVAKVVKGGRRFSFSALVVVGDGKDKVGYGLGKAGEVPDAIRKGAEQARKIMRDVPKYHGTIPFEVVGEFGSTKVVMFPAKQGRGIIAGGSVRTIMELSGISDIVCKIHGSKNYQNVVRATFNGLDQLVSAKDYAARRGLDEAEAIVRRHATTATSSANAALEKTIEKPTAKAEGDNNNDADGTNSEQGS